MFTIISAVNATQGGRLIYSGEVTDAGDVTPGKLYKACAREYGRCIGKMYIDGEDGSPKPIGWVFVKLEEYTDTKEKYLQETWVEVASNVEIVPASMKIER